LTVPSRTSHTTPPPHPSTLFPYTTLFRSTFTPRVEPISIDEAYLDLTGCPAPSTAAASPEAPAGSPLAFARAIKGRIGETLRLPVSIGVAPNKFLAKLASELAEPDGLRVIGLNAAVAVLAPLPVTVLWGVG